MTGVYMGWRWRNLVPYQCQLVFGAILWARKLWEMFAAVISIKYIVLGFVSRLLITDTSLNKVVEFYLNSTKKIFAPYLHSLRHSIDSVTSLHPSPICNVCPNRHRRMGSSRIVLDLGEILWPWPWPWSPLGLALASVSSRHLGIDASFGVMLCLV